jgi:hypothetical protein
MRTRSRREEGRALLLLVVLCALAGGGAWNYHRNWTAEKAAEEARPLSGYDTADLEALADAYRQEIRREGARYEKSRGARAEARDRAYFDEQVQEFEMVQRQSERAREAGARLSESEAALRDIEAELGRRGPRESEWQAHLRRLTTI